MTPRAPTTTACLRSAMGADSLAYGATSRARLRRATVHYGIVRVSIHPTLDDIIALKILHARQDESRQSLLKAYKRLEEDEERAALLNAVGSLSRCASRH